MNKTTLNCRPSGNNLIKITLFIVILALLASCNENAPKTNDKTCIEFWTISLKPTYTTYIEELIDKYEKLHPEVEVEWLDMPINVVMQKIMASIAGGAPPDVVNLNSGYAQIMAQNLALTCVDDVVPPETKSRYFEGLWNAAKFEGKNYAIPWYVTTKITIYNSDIFQEAGLNPNYPPRTWDEVAQYGRIIKQKTGRYGYMPAIKMTEDFQIFGAPVVSPDGKKALFNCQAGIATLQWFLNLKEEGVMPEETLIEGYQGALNRYQSGNLAMLIAGPTLLLRIKKDAPGIYEKTRLAPMPLGLGNVIPAATMNLVVPRSSRHKHLAVDFALFVTNDENQLQFCKLAPLMPSTKAAANNDFFKKSSDDPIMAEASRISIKQLYKAKDLSLGLNNSTELNKALAEEVEKAYYGRVSAKAALDNAARKWDEILSW